MKTRMKNQLVNKKGLTLIQTLVVVAIVVILLGVAFIGIQGLVDRINQTKLDNVAQSMYVSAQNRIRELKASGEIDRLFTVTAAELGDVVGKPVDWDLDDGDTVNHEFLKYFYHNKNNSPASTSSDLVDFFFPKGSIDGNVLDNNWVIELDPVTGYVYSAFYSETRLADDYYVNNNSTLDTTLDPDETSSIRFKEFRHGLKGNNLSLIHISRVYILQGRDLRATKTIEMGCRDVDMVIADYYNIDVYLAASYRETDHEGILESDVCRAVYNRISLEVMKAINFYKYENRQSEFEDCFICGDCSDTEALVNNMLAYVRLKRANLDEILPEECRGMSDAPRALMSIGVTL